MKAVIVPFLLGLSFLSTVTFGLTFSTFHPRYEGTFSVTVRCQSGDPTPACSTFDSGYQLVLFNGLNELPIVILPKNKSNPLYRFYAVSFEKEGAEISGRAPATASHEAVEIGLQLGSHLSGRPGVFGWIRDPHFRFDLVVEGTQTLTPFAVFNVNFNPEHPLLISSLVGNYEGTLEGPATTSKVKLAIRKSAISEGILATLQTIDGTSGSGDFLFSEIYSQYGTFAIVGQSPDLSLGRKRKLVLTYLENPFGDVELMGRAFYSENPGYHNLRFRRVN